MMTLMMTGLHHFRSPFTQSVTLLPIWMVSKKSFPELIGSFWATAYSDVVSNLYITSVYDRLMGEKPKFSS